MRRGMAASFGKIPMTSLWRLISPLKRSSGFVLCKFGPPLGWEIHVGENVCLGIIHQRHDREAHLFVEIWRLPSFLQSRAVLFKLRCYERSHQNG